MDGQPPLFPAILAGGHGTRFWPLSRRRRPKPFLSPDGGPSLLRRTWGRAIRLAPPGAIHVAVASELAGEVVRALPELPRGNLVLEPEGRDTGPAAVNLAWRLRQRHPDAVVVLLPADHLVEQEARFEEAVRAAARTAVAEDALVCLAIPPSGPSEAYGYLEFDGPPPGHGAPARIARFVEKPARRRAEEMLAHGQAAWNAGIFIWRAERFLAEVERVSPELRASLQQLTAGADAVEFFAGAPRVAVDRAVMERTERAWAVGADVGWDDVGSWDALARHLAPDDEGNRGPGKRVALGATGCLVHSPDKPVVLLGVQDLVVVECDDVLLVARRSDAQRVREVPDLLRRRGLEDRT